MVQSASYVQRDCAPQAKGKVKIRATHEMATCFLAEGLFITVAWGIAPGIDAEMRTDWPQAIITSATVPM